MTTADEYADIKEQVRQSTLLQLEDVQTCTHCGLSIQRTGRGWYHPETQSPWCPNSPEPPNDITATPGAGMAQSEVTRVKRAVELEREDLEDELGPFNIHTEAGRVYLTPDGCIDPQWEAVLNSRHADARLVIKEVT